MLNFGLSISDTYSQWRKLGILGSKIKDQLQKPLLYETFILASQIMVKGVQSITNDADVIHNINYT
jgi:hypothetical protein